MGKTSVISPLAPKSIPPMPAIEGVELATCEAAIRYQNRTDVLLVYLCEGTRVAGVFTRSKCPSAAVDWCKAQLSSGHARALLVNSGNANAFTGSLGAKAAQQSAEIAASALKIKPQDVFIASTGVIGEPLDAQKFNPVMPVLLKSLSAQNWENAARAIMTTDTFPKLASRQIKISGKTITLNGFAKGAGMIAPDMATMLAFIFTDAAIAAPALQSLVKKTVEPTFNSVTIDGDTSTSDTLLMFATGKANNQEITDTRSQEARQLAKALQSLMAELAEMVARDGEGARKLVRITVEEAASKRAAKKIALSIGNSPLVKTAIAGEDANWGRIVMAIGKAGEKAERDKISIWFGDTCVAQNGMRAKGYDEAHVSALMKKDVIDIKVQLGLGTGKATVLTCDLTKDYVAINGDYRS